jgi:bifunctional DNase/RNase
VVPAFSVMEVVDVVLELPSQFPVVTLREADAPGRVLLIPIGLAEGVAMATALGKVPTPRPLTHELFATVLACLAADIVAVRLVGRRGGTYLGEMAISSARGRDVLVCRPSDGLTLALRQGVRAPILADVRLLEGSGDVAPPEGFTAGR